MAPIQNISWRRQPPKVFLRQPRDCPRQSAQPGLRAALAGRKLQTQFQPLPDREMSHLLMQVLASDYFRGMGFEPFVKNGIPDKRAILHEPRGIAGRHRSSFPGFDPGPGRLDYSLLPAFAGHPTYGW